MPSFEQTERFLGECALYRKALKTAPPLTEKQLLFVKTKLFEVICDFQEIERTFRGPVRTRDLTDPSSDPISDPS